MFDFMTSDKKIKKWFFIAVIAIFLLGMVYTFTADYIANKKNPIVPVVPTEVVDSVHTANN